MSDKFATNTDMLDAPGRQAAAVVPSDTVALDPVPKGIYVGTGGNVTIRAIDSAADVTYKNLGNGSYIAIRVLYVRATGTTAADMIAEA